MPDNVEKGALEHFLQQLIEANDPVFRFANECVETLYENNGANFNKKYKPESKKSKALITTYLAWQEEPGQSYSLGVRSGYFDAHGELAQQFVDWLHRLFKS